MISYGRATEVPGGPGLVRRKSPIMAQTPFSPMEKTLDYLRQHYSDLNIGIGAASSSGGMAVLEALVCALEV